MILMTRSVFFIVICIGVHAGCVLPPFPTWEDNESGASTDAGAAREAGPPLDAGLSPAKDGGLLPDVGFAVGDGGASGTGESDGGLSAPDAGNVDAGAIADSGVVPTDGGSLGDDAGRQDNEGGPVPTDDGGSDSATDGGYITGPVDMQFAVISAGTFTMGSPSTERGHISGESQHEVTLTRPFAMATTEVTQGQWKAMSGGVNPSYFTSCGDDCPVEQVDWYSTLGYANALSEADGLEKCYTLTGCTDETDGWKDGTHSGCSDATFVGLDCEGYRLPTEAEWEYAYRAGTTTAYYSGENSAYNTCDDDENLDKIGWYCKNGDGRTHRAGYKDANAWGLYDMSGNVWEFTWDRYGNYPDETTDYAGPETGSDRVLRGGAYHVLPQQARAAFRVPVVPNSRGKSIGFRLTRTLP